MIRLMKGAAILAALSLPAPAIADAVSVCVFKKKNANDSLTVVHFELAILGPGTTPDDAEMRAKNAYPRSRYRYYDCYNSGQAEINGGWYVILESGKKEDSAGKPVRHIVAGFGASREEAMQNATDNFRSLPGLKLSEHTNGMKVIDAKAFGPQ